MVKKKFGYLIGIFFMLSLIFVSCGNGKIEDNSDGIDDWKIFISDVQKEFGMEAGEIVIKEGKSKEICTVEGIDSDNIKINIDEKSKKIVIENKKKWIDSNENIKININVPVGYLEINNGNFKLDVEAKGEKFRGSFKCGLNGNIQFSKVNKVELDIKGAGNLNLLGKAEITDIDIKGGASIDGLNLETSEAIVSVKGVGNVSIYAIDSLDANLKGVGQILYKGNPRLRESVDGLGRVEKLKE